MIGFRHSDSRFPFLWERADQPPARWHGSGQGPAQYIADTPAGAWAEFLRHEGITEVEDLQGVSRALWAIDIDEGNFEKPDLSDDILYGGELYYPECQAEAERLRAAGTTALQAPSAALNPGAANGYVVNNGIQSAPPSDGQVFVLFGARPTTVGWLIVDHGSPPASVLPLVRHL
jgi:hypothetical protein